MASDEPAPYGVNPKDGRWEVVDGSGRVVMVCRDESSATDYMVVLNEAYHRGYKAGYREGRKG